MREEETQFLATHHYNKNVKGPTALNMPQNNELSIEIWQVVSAKTSSSATSPTLWILVKMTVGVKRGQYQRSNTQDAGQITQRIETQGETTAALARSRFEYTRRENHFRV
jgi:hypothetical protein